MRIRLFLIGLMMLFFAASFAQLSIDDILKGRINESKIDSTQLSPSKKDSANIEGSNIRMTQSIEFVTNTIKSELSIIRQQYRLERNGEYFGMDNNLQFGESFSLGIKVAGGMFLLNDVIEPWVGDNNYKRANESNKYNPSLFWSFQRSLSEDSYQRIDLELGTQYVTPMNADKSLYIHADVRSDFGLSLDKTLGDKSGYMVWVYSSNLQDSAMTISLSTELKDIKTSLDNKYLAMSPNNPDKILGGLYVVPKYERGGRVQFLLAGVAVHNEKREWQLQLLAEDEGPTLSQAEEDSKKKKSKRK